MARQTVLITNGRFNTALELARQLNDEGCRVLVADTFDRHLCRYSNAVDRCYKVASPRNDPAGFTDTIVRIAEEEEVDLIIPIWEETFALAKARSRFPTKTRIFACDVEQWQRLHNKWTFFQTAKEHGLSHPYTCQVDDAINQIEGRRVFKPVFTRGGAGMVITDKKEVPPLPEVSGGYVAQKFISGARYCSFSICDQGRILAHTAYPVEFTIEGFSCVYYRSVDHTAIREWVERFVAAEKYTGQIGFDFVETEGGAVHAFDCNPRCTNGLHLVAATKGLARSYVDRQPMAATPAGIRRQITVAMLTYGGRQALRDRRLFRYVRRLMTTSDTAFSFRDPLPMVVQPVIMATYFLEAAKEKISLPRFFLRDINYDG